MGFRQVSFAFSCQCRTNELKKPMYRPVVVTSNRTATESRCSEQRQRTDNGCSVLDLMACSFTATREGLLLSGNSVPTDVFTRPLLPVINELSACVWKQLVYLRDTCAWSKALQSEDQVAGMCCSALWVISSFRDCGLFDHVWTINVSNTWAALTFSVGSWTVW